MNKRYNSLNAWLKNYFRDRVYKVTLESGCTCPNLDGTVGSHGCIFCNFLSYLPATNPNDLKTSLAKIPINQQLENGLKYAKKRHGSTKAIAYFQSGSNTHGDSDTLQSIFEEAISHPQIVGLAISTRPDCIRKEHLEIFKSLASKKLLWIELGLQSSHNLTLERIGRGHSVETFQQTCSKLNDINIPVCAHVILGLPGETKKMMLDTARFLNSSKIWGVKIHNLHVLKNTAIEKQFNAGEIKIPSLETYANWAADFLEVLSPEIIIHRVSSHSPKSITVAPAWSTNKLAIFNEVEKELERRNTHQGKKFTPQRLGF